MSVAVSRGQHPPVRAEGQCTDAARPGVGGRIQYTPTGYVPEVGTAVVVAGRQQASTGAKSHRIDGGPSKEFICKNRYYPVTWDIPQVDRISTIGTSQNSPLRLKASLSRSPFECAGSERVRIITPLATSHKEILPSGLPVATILPSRLRAMSISTPLQVFGLVKMCNGGRAGAWLSVYAATIAPTAKRQATAIP